MVAEEPRIQYATTNDGVSIAFSVTGEGFPLVHVGWAIYGHLEMEWRIPEYRDWYQGLAKKRKLIRYDSRGTGLSQRDISDYSLSTRADDLSAVVDYLGLKRFALLGLDPSVAVTYASSNAERVSHLVLWTPVTRLSDYESRATVVKSVAYQDWNLWAETESEWVGIGAPESRKLLTEMLREFPSRDAYRSFEEEEWDLTTVLSTLRCETLVLHRRGNPFVRPETVQRVAATVHGSRLVMLEGREWLPGAGDADRLTSLGLVLRATIEDNAVGLLGAKPVNPDIRVLE